MIRAEKSEDEPKRNGRVVGGERWRAMAVSGRRQRGVDILAGGGVGWSARELARAERKERESAVDDESGRCSRAERGRGGAGDETDEMRENAIGVRISQLVQMGRSVGISAREVWVEESASGGEAGEAGGSGGTGGTGGTGGMQRTQCVRACERPGAGGGGAAGGGRRGRGEAEAKRLDKSAARAEVEPLLCDVF
jgi:hypothetical protein